MSTGFWLTSRIVLETLTRSRIELSIVQLVGPALANLIQSGIKEQDIINLASIFERYSTGIDRQSLISELDNRRLKYYWIG